MQWSVYHCTLGPHCSLGPLAVPFCKRGHIAIGPALLVNLLMNVEELKLIHLDGEMLLKLDVFLFILMDRLVSNRFTVLLQCEENTK